MRPLTTMTRVAESFAPLRSRWLAHAGIIVVAIVACLLGSSMRAQTPVAPSAAATMGVTRVPVVFDGGHDTEGRDRGRPVALVAGALGVTPEIFREAFSRVKPAPAGSAPEPGQVRENKAALMAALAPHGITNERLDTVSNYYRYVRSRGELWPTKPATAVALVVNGKVTGFEVTDGGYGYSSAPTVAVPGVNAPAATVRLAFDKDFARNGSVAAITLSGSG